LKEKKDFPSLLRVMRIIENLMKLFPELALDEAEVCDSYNSTCIASENQVFKKLLINY
jgi:hypothetical protein